MRLFAIEFRTSAGERFDLSMAAIHTAMFTGSFMVFPIQVLSAVLMLTTDRAQGLSDHMLGTVAVNRKAGA